jgi:hypothetical protein
MEIVRFQPDHLAGFLPHYAFELPAIELVRANPPASAAFARSPALSYRADRRVVAMGGVLRFPRARASRGR